MPRDQIKKKACFKSRKCNGLKGLINMKLFNIITEIVKIESNSIINKHIILLFTINVVYSFLGNVTLKIKGVY